ncbi:MAG TPA: ABC transporter substrate-binding protein [Acidimicrobiales bacterium]|nr:ABC transporter substrate-binding protein [Acidimicrobiales bacterium]
MRNRRRLAVVLVALAAFAGCTDSSKPNGAASSASTAAEKPVAGGTLRVGIERPKTLDPAHVSPGSQSELLVADLLFDRLTHMDDKAVSATPAIASSWHASADQKSWQFTVRADARFSNGRAITPADVKYTLERVAKLGESSLAALRVDMISGFTPFTTGAAPELIGVHVIDDHTIGIDLDTPVAVLPELLAAPEFGIVPKEAVEAANPPFATAPVGSGPFSYAGTQGDVVKLVRSTQGSALLDAIELHEYDAANIGKSYDDFVAGNLDWSVVPNDRAEDAAQRFGADDFRPFDAELFYAFNLLDPTFADVRFRQAIVKSIDRAALVKAVYPGVADPLAGVVPAGVAGHVDDPCGEPCKFDPPAARALLAQAFPDGHIPTINLDFFTGTGEAAVAGTITADFAAVGITVTPRPKSPDDYDVFAVSGQQQLFRLGSIGLYPSPDAYLVPLFLTGSRDNATGFSNPAVDQLLQAARANPDPTARQKLYQQAEQQIMAQAPIVPIAQFRTKAVVSKRVRDLVVTVTGTFAGEKVWLG